MFRFVLDSRSLGRFMGEGKAFSVISASKKSIVSRFPDILLFLSSFSCHVDYSSPLISIPTNKKAELSSDSAT